MQEFAQLEPLARDTPQTKRGHERCLALLLSANELFLKHGYDAVSLDDIVNHAGGPKLQSTNFSAIKKACLPRFAIIAGNSFLKTFAFLLNLAKMIFVLI